MKKTWQGAAVMGMSLALVVGCADGDPQATDPTPGSGTVQAPTVAPNTSINAVMVGLVDHAAHEIWDVADAGMAPESNEDWEELTHYAIQLIASGSYITVAGKGELDANWVAQTDWTVFAQDLADAGGLALDAAMRRDVNDLLVAGDSLILACEGCHAEYKPAVPTEGILHPHSD
jgi:hypothetical protein